MIANSPSQEISMSVSFVEPQEHFDVYCHFPSISLCDGFGLSQYFDFDFVPAPQVPWHFVYSPSLQPPGLGGVMFSYRDVGVKVHCCSFVFILVCSQQRAVWAGPSCIPGSDSRPPPGRSSPAQPLPSRQCFLRTRSHLLTSDRGFKFLTNTFPETFIVKQSYSQNIFNSNLS